MRMLFLAAGVASLALAAPALAEKGGHGGGKKGGDHAAKFERGSGGGGKAFKAERGGGKEFRAERKRERVFAPQRHESRGERRGDFRLSTLRAERGEAKAERKWAKEAAKGREKAIERRMKAEDKRFEAREKLAKEHFKAERRFAKQREKAFEQRFEQRERRIASRDWDDDRWDDHFRRGYPAGFVDGCPPGLAKKHNGCLPPGQAKKLVGNVLPATYRSNLLPSGLRDYWNDDDRYYYRYGDGYLYRVNRQNNLIASLLPLFGGGYGLGQAFPASLGGYGMPSYFEPFYQDSPYVDYRYANGYVYAVDPYTGRIEDIIPAYDQGYGVGQMLPASYGYYNLPYPYRDWYPASSDSYYRYAPGAIYQVDPTTSLITAVVSLLAPGLGIGQPLPTGYDVYNVPYAYRSQYYDRPDAWYRYSNGNIYQVDPTTRLVTALVAAIT